MSVSNGFILLTVLCAYFGGATAACEYKRNEDMIEYFCMGGHPSDLNALPEGTGKIRIQNMRLGRITADTFSRFGSELWVLICSHCGIVDIEPGAFRHLVNLQHLSLDNNHLTTVRASWFKGLDYLTYLDLNYNDIRVVENGVFSTLPGLVDLRLSGNRLECLNLEDMSNLKELRRMFLNENSEFKCPNAVSNFLAERGVSFDKDPTWRRVPYDLVSPETLSAENTQPPAIKMPSFPEWLHSTLTTTPEASETVPYVTPMVNPIEETITFLQPTIPVWRSTEPTETESNFVGSGFQHSTEPYYERPGEPPESPQPIVPTDYPEYYPPHVSFEYPKHYPPQVSSENPEHYPPHISVEYPEHYPPHISVEYPEHYPPHVSSEHPEHYRPHVSFEHPENYPPHMSSEHPEDYPPHVSSEHPEHYPPHASSEHPGHYPPHASSEYPERYAPYVPLTDNPNMVTLGYMPGVMNTSTSSPEPPLYSQYENENKRTKEPVYPNEETRPAPSAPSQVDRHETPGFVEPNMEHTTGPDAVSLMPDESGSASIAEDDINAPDHWNPEPESADPAIRVSRPLPYSPSEAHLPSSPGDFFQGPYYEPTVTTRPPPLENYHPPEKNDSDPVLPIETTTTDKPLPDCPNRCSAPITHAFRTVWFTVLLIVVKNVLIEGY